MSGSKSFRLPVDFQSTGIFVFPWDMHLTIAGYYAFTLRY